jgi:hypothetical protein
VQTCVCCILRLDILILRFSASRNVFNGRELGVAFDAERTAPLFLLAMVSRRKEVKKAVNMLGSVAVDALNLAVPLAKAIPLLGSTVEGSLQAVLFIINIKDVGSFLAPSLQSNFWDEGRQDEEGEMSALG